MREKAIVEQLLKEINKYGYAYKVHNLSVAGLPDIDGFMLIDGVYYYLKLEVKNAVGRYSMKQKYYIDLYKKAGYVSGIVRSVDDLWNLLQSYGVTKKN
jgi:hypothetical protein